MASKDTSGASQTGKDKISVTGLVIPAAWDETGQVIAVAIAAFNEDRYLLAENAAAKDLLNFIEQEVTVVGNLKTAGSNLCLTILDFLSFGNKSAEVPDE